MEALDTFEAARAIQAGLESIERGEPGVPAETVLEEVREILGIDTNDRP